MNKVAIIFVFVFSYLIFLVANFPANKALSFYTLPKNVQVAGATGTIWQGKLQTLVVNNQVVNNLHWQLSPLSVLSFNPTIDATFGGSNVDGPEGKATVSGFISQQIKVENTSVLMAANDIVSQLPMPVPLTARGSIQLEIPGFEMGQPVCQLASGDIKWRNAEVSAFQEDIALSDLSATLSCEEGALAIKIDPNNILGLDFTAYVRQLNKVSGSGMLEPGADFPQKLKPVLTFIGRPDSRGRYRLKI